LTSRGHFSGSRARKAGRRGDGGAWWGCPARAGRAGGADGPAIRDSIVLHPAVRPRIFLRRQGPGGVTPKGGKKRKPGALSGAADGFAVGRFIKETGHDIASLAGGSGSNRQPAEARKRPFESFFGADRGPRESGRGTAGGGLAPTTVGATPNRGPSHGLFEKKGGRGGGPGLWGWIRLFPAGRFRWEGRTAGGWVRPPIQSGTLRRRARRIKPWRGPIPGGCLAKGLRTFGQLTGWENRAGRFGAEFPTARGRDVQGAQVRGDFFSGDSGGPREGRSDVLRESCLDGPCSTAGAPHHFGGSGVGPGGGKPESWGGTLGWAGAESIPAGTCSAFPQRTSRAPPVGLRTGKAAGSGGGRKRQLFFSGGSCGHNNPGNCRRG